MSVDQLFKKYLNKGTMKARIENIKRWQKINKAWGCISCFIDANHNVFKHADLTSLEAFKARLSRYKFEQFTDNVKTLNRLGSSRTISSIMVKFLRVHGPKFVSNVCSVMIFAGLEKTPLEIAKAIPTDNKYAPHSKDFKDEWIRYINLVEL
jgi:3-methyladenine DNA glycosylase Tag